MQEKSIVIYHGSKNIIEKPVYGKGKPYNDYGLGFYCTASLDMALEWAVSSINDGYANKYKIYLKGLKIINLNTSEYNILNWLAVLLENRTFDEVSPLAIEAKDYLLKNFLIDYKDADIIIGYRADDSYFSFASDFLNGTISLRQLKSAMALGSLGEQIVIKSKKAFSRIRFIESIKADKENWYLKRKTRDLKVRNDYFNSRNDKRLKSDLFIQNIIDEGIKHNDARL